MTVVIRTSSGFRREVVDPLVQSFRGDPTSLPKALSAVWSVDAYASHVAVGREGEGGRSPNSMRLEKEVKKQIGDLSDYYGCFFFLLQEFSNAAKHGVRANRAALFRSIEVISVDDWPGWTAWTAQSSHFGEQLVGNLDLSFDPDLRAWVDRQGRAYIGLAFRAVPILDVVERALYAVDQFELKLTPPGSAPASPPAAPPWSS